MTICVWRGKIKSQHYPHKIDRSVADSYITLSGHHKWPLARNFLICTGTMLACSKEMGFQNLRMYLRGRFSMFQANAQISSGVLLLLYSDKSPACSL